MANIFTRPRAPTAADAPHRLPDTSAAPGTEPVNVEAGIRDLLARTDRVTSLTVGKIQTIGHLRRTARDIASNLFGIHTETAEVVALQNEFERALNRFCEANASPSAALAYISPDAARAQQVAQSLAARATAVQAAEMTADQATSGEDGASATQTAETPATEPAAP